MTLEIHLERTRTIVRFRWLYCIWMVSDILSLIWTLMGGGCIPLGDPQLASLNAAYHKKQDSIWFRGGDPNAFWDIRPFMKWRGWGKTLRDPKLVWLNASYHKEQEYIWFRAGDLNSFWDLPLMKWTGWGKDPDHQGDTLKPLTESVIRNKNIYGYVVGIWMVSEILGLLWSGGGGAWHRCTLGLHSMSLNSSYHKEQEYIGFRGGDLDISKILGLSFSERGRAWP